MLSETQPAPVYPHRMHVLKYITMALFILLPYAAFWLGMKYQENQQKNLRVTLPPSVVPALTQPAVDDTSNWKIYTNQKFQYSVKYPSDWRIEMNCFGSANNKGCVVFKSPDDNIQQYQALPEGRLQGNGGEIYISGDPSIGAHTIGNTKDEFCKPNAPVKITDCHDIDIGNYQAIERTEPASTVIGILENNKVVIEIFADYSQVSKQQILVTFSKAVSTFKFIKPSQSIEIDNWKTFIYTDSLFSFKYPENWYYEDDSKYGGASTGTTYAFFKIGTTADHSFGDHSGNQVFIVSFDGDMSKVSKPLQGTINVQTDLQTAQQSGLVDIYTNGGLVHLGGVNVDLQTWEKIFSTFKFLD